MAPIPRSGYLSKVGVIFTITLADLLINAVGDFRDALGPSSATLAVGLLGASLLIQLLNFLLVWLLLFGTYLFTVGLIGLLVREFRGALIWFGCYALIYAAYAGCKAALLFGPARKSQDGLWDEPIFVFLSILQKIAAMGYYLALLRTAVSLGAPKWYQRGPWVQKFSLSSSAALEAGSSDVGHMR